MRLYEALYAQLAGSCSLHGCLTCDYMQCSSEEFSSKTFSISVAFSKQISQSLCVRRLTFIWFFLFNFQHVGVCWHQRTIVSGRNWLLLTLVLWPIFWKLYSNMILFYFIEMKNMTRKIFLVSLKGVRSSCPDLEATLNDSDALWCVAYFKLKLVLLCEPDP